MKRTAFTLVELLVALAIMVILTTLVLAAFQRDDGERLSATSRKVQAVLEGARSHAIATKQPRGVRLVPSPTDQWVIDRIVPIGAVDDLSGTLNISFDTGINAWTISENTAGLWRRLAPVTATDTTGRDLIRVGGHAEIPSGSGVWYTLSAVGFDPWNNRLSLAGGLSASERVNMPSHPQHGELLAGAAEFLDTDGDNVPDTWIGTLQFSVPYRMRLAPTVINAESVALERGIVIDRWASQLPPSLEIMYDARGGLDGSLAAGGLIHLYVTTLADVELTRNLVSPNHPADGGTLTAPIVPANAPNVPRLPPYLVTIYAQTGQVVTSPVDLTDGDADLLADQPFRYAQRGREAK